MLGKIIFANLLFILGMVATAEAVSFKLPIGSVVTQRDETGKTWKQNGILNVTYVSAVMQFNSALNSKGWHKIQQIDMGNDGMQSLMVWERGKVRITLMLWKISTSKTGFSWGDNEGKE